MLGAFVVAQLPKSALLFLERLHHSREYHVSNESFKAALNGTCCNGLARSDHLLLP